MAEKEIKECYIYIIMSRYVNILMSSLLQHSSKACYGYDAFCVEVLMDNHSSSL